LDDCPMQSSPSPISRLLGNWADEASNQTTKSEAIFQDLCPEEV
jgi:hypothetical protein